MYFFLLSAYHWVLLYVGLMVKKIDVLFSLELSNSLVDAWTLLEELDLT